MALRLKEPPAPLRQVLQSQGMFGMGVQDNLRRSMDSTYANLRGLAPQGNIFDTPTTQPQAAPAAPVASMIDGAPSIFGIGMPRQQEAMVGTLPAPTQIAGGLGLFKDAGQAYAFQTALRDRGININPEGQAPGDFNAAMQAAEGVFNRNFGPGATQAPNYRAFAPTGLRGRALAAGGQPVEGVGGAIVTASPNAIGGTNFALSQNPATVGSPSQPAPAPQTTPQPGPTPLQQAQQQYQAALAPSPGVRLQSFESGNEIITVDQQGNVVARAPRTPTPTGYEPAPEGGIKPIKGSPQEAESVAAAEKKKKAAEEAMSKANLVISKINEAIPDVGVMTAGPVGAVAGVVPGTPAYDMQATIDTVKANIGFDQLQAMRAASPTGGALGQVAVRELDFLQAALGSLDRKQSPEQLRKNLQQIRTHYNRWAQAYQGINPDQQAQSGGFPPDKLNRLNELRAKMAGAKEQESEQ